MPDLITPLQLRSYSIEELSLVANAEFRSGNVSPEPRVGVDFEYIPLESGSGYPEFLIQLMIDVNKRKSDFETGQYKIHFTIQTSFQFCTDAEESKRFEKILLPNGLAMTYSIARGIIGQLTGMGRSGVLILPTINMHSVIERKLRSLEKNKRKAELSRE